MPHAYDKETRFITAADGTRIAYHVHVRASGTPLEARPSLLLTNGIGTTENFWRFLVESLSADYRVVHWDYRGHGSSEVAASGDYRIPTQSEDLVRIAERVREESRTRRPPLHVAFSMGVAVLLEAYRRKPDLVPAMALLSGAAESPGARSFPFALPGVMRAYRASLDALRPAVPLVAPAVHAALRSGLAYPVGRALGLLRKRAPREDIQQFMLGLSKMDALAYYDTLRGLYAADASDVLPTVKVPTLIIAAENDWMMPRRQVEELREKLPQAEFLEVMDAGHAGLIEAGEEIAFALRRFFDAQAGRTVH